MKNILVINLKRFGDIICSSNLINNLKSKYPKSNISILTFESSRKATEILPNVSNVFTVDREEILLFLKNKLFSDTVAFQSFIDDIEKLNGVKWDNVINYSNDKISSIIVSYLSPDYFNGVKINEKNLVEYSNQWALYFNEVLTSRTTSPVNVIDSMLKVCDIEDNPKNSKLLSNPEFNKLTYKNFNDLRKKNKKDNSELPKIVGIQVKSSSIKKDLSIEVLADSIKKIKEKKSLIPVLITSPSEEERTFCKDLYELLDFKVLTVECDFQALVSVLMNVDYLITPDTSVKHMGDILDTPVLELSIGPAPMYKQASRNVGNIILSPDLNCRPCSLRGDCDSDNYLECREMISSDDVINGLSLLIDYKENGDLIIESNYKFSNNLSIYIVQKDLLGNFYKKIFGKLNTNHEMNYFYSRAFTNLIIDKTTDSKSNIDFTQMIIEKNGKHSIDNWIRSQKSEITENLKSVLSTLRSLKTVAKNEKTASNFVKSLNSLIDFIDDNSPVKITGLMLRGKMDTIGSSSIIECSNKLEKYLYDHKNYLGYYLTLLNEIEQVNIKYFEKDKMNQEIIV